MKIVRVEPIVLRLPEVDTSRADGTQDAFLVRVHTDEGLVGIGEADSSPYLVRTAIEMPSSHAVARGVGEVLVGEDPLQVDRLWQLLYRATSYYGRSGLALHVISAIDIALWDLAGRAAGQPVCELLGGRRVDAVPVYASEVMPDTPKEARELAERAAAAGYRGFKLGWGPLGGGLARDVALIEAARAGIGPDRDLMIDGGQAYSVKSALRLLESLGHADLYWFEEPLAPEDHAGYRRLADRTVTRIAAGEADAGTAAFEALVRDGGVDVLQPDLSRCGGFTVGRSIRELVRGAGTLVVPHCFSTGVLVAASLHFAASLDEPTYSEYSVASSPFVNEILTRPFSLEDGALRVPTAPGLGVELNDELVERMRVA
jgi:L-alanine-DL-glutamate epimerase-like enolase superfamily enzyme